MQAIASRVQFAFVDGRSPGKECLVCHESLGKENGFVRHATASSSVFHEFHIRCVLGAFQHTTHAKMVGGNSIRILTCPYCRSEVINTYQLFLKLISNSFTRSRRQVREPFKQIEELHWGVLQSLNQWEWQHLLLNALVKTDLDTWKALLSGLMLQPFGATFFTEFGALLFAGAAGYGRTDLLRHFLPLLADGTIPASYTVNGQERNTRVHAFQLVVVKQHVASLNFLIEHDVVPEIAIIKGMSIPGIILDLSHMGAINTKAWALLYAAQNGLVEICKVLFPLLKSGKIPETIMLDGQSSKNLKLATFFNAVEGVHANVVGCLLEHGLIPEKADIGHCQSINPRVWACVHTVRHMASLNDEQKESSREILKILLPTLTQDELRETITCTCPDQEGSAANFIFKAVVVSKQFDVLPLLIKHQVVPDVVIDQTGEACKISAGARALILAVNNKKEAEMSRVLLNHLTSDVLQEKFTFSDDPVDSLAAYVLKIVIDTNQFEVLRLLIEHKIIPETVKLRAEKEDNIYIINAGVWALIWAAKKNHIETMRVLLPLLEDGTIPAEYTLPTGERVKTRERLIALNAGNQAVVDLLTAGAQESAPIPVPSDEASHMEEGDPLQKRALERDSNELAPKKPRTA